ncbi:YidH family protein [Arthrobacter zhaoguopingii]|uniref:YidH family protein n=1 Tax=Arthrobacter zhaoguopingii TaxID=2681491 RepID=UPI00135BF346|nr:DUF202 domain-containing protein [Arthrobacter zhaoguopingii]
MSSAGKASDSAEGSEARTQVPRGRFAARILGGGEEPDPRFTLANERTFLAWIRTALAFLAGGIAVEAFTSGMFPVGIRRTLAVLLLVLAMMLASAAGFRWLGIERAMRCRGPLPLPILVPVLAAGAAVAAGIVVIFVLVRPV